MNGKGLAEAAFVAMYLAAAVLANLVVAWLGPIATPVVAFVLVALDLVTRDALHERWRDHLARNMFLLICAGSALTCLVNMGAARVALASTAAFAAAATADTVVYHVLRRWPRLKRVLGSNVVSAFVDSAVFPTIAFGGPILWVTLVQWGMKVLGGYLWALLFVRTIWREVAAET